MNQMANRRNAKETLDAYTRAVRPTPQLIANFCAATAQMLADDMEGRVTLALPIGLSVVREPTPQPGRAGRASMIA
jgi:hypothetical protein